MSQLDDLLGGLLGGLTGGRGGGAGGGAGSLLGALVPMLSGLLAGGGLGRILSGLRANGMGAQADSWISTGENEPVSGDQVRQALGEDEIAQIASKLGVSHEQAAEALAEVLPQVVDRVTPEGQLPPEEKLDELFGRLAQTAGDR